jgi:PAS domain S-box-containing protein
MKEAISAWFSYEIFSAGTPEKNPQRAPYWTAPYLDAGGTGAMVSHGAPVYVDDKFFGVVGTDVSLVTLEQFLLSLPREVGRLLILNDKGTVLADSAGSPRNAIRKAADVLPVGVDSNTIMRASQSTNNRIRVADRSLIVRSTEYAPWTLLYLVSEQEIAELLFPRFFPYGVIMAVLALTFFFALYLLRREFISPALTLVRYIQSVSRDPDAFEPRLPQLWQPWMKIVSRTFTSNREASQQLRESETRLQQILNNSSAVIYVRDLEERFILVNRPFERLLDVTQDAVAGKQLEEVFPSHDAAQFRVNDMRVVENNSVMEFEESLTLQDGLHTYLSIKFPLYDTEANIYAICGISTDITKRKQTEEVLRQTALGISEANGEDVFSSLVAYLAKAVATDLAFIGILDGHDHIRTRALYANGQIKENITYPLAHSPCENVVGQQFRFYPDRIQLRFPKDTLLQEIAMESYAAIPLFGSSGEVLGLLAVLHSQPLQDEALIESILQIFSGRAASELEREHTDVALRASEASYRAIFETSEDAIFVHDLDTGAILDVNQKACEVYGYSCEEMRKLDIGAISSGIPPYTQEDAVKLIARAVAGERMQFEWHRKSRDGSLHWDEVFVKRASIGGTDRILAFTREITERKQAEEQLRASEEQYRAIFNASSDALMLWDTDGRIVDTNRATWVLGGYSQEEFMAVPLREHVDDSSLAAFEEFMDAISHGRAFETEGKVIRKDGSLMDLEIRGVPMHYRGKPHVLSMARDITEQKQASEELARQRDAMRQNEKLSAMGALVANVAHELNNPLAILMGRAALLEKKLNNAPAQKEAEKIREAAERCGRIVRTFLGMARQRPAERRPTCLNDVVVGALDLLGYGLRTSGITVTTKYDSGLPFLEMDGDQVGQVVVNLLVNAQQALSGQSETRRIEIATGVADATVFLRVIDNGPGVPGEIRERIFDPFFTTKPEGSGTGVGLAVSRAIMREHQGDLQLEDSGSGAAFKLWFPLGEAQQPGESTKAEEAFYEIMHEGNVLVVDDEVEIAGLVSDILQSAGFTVVVVNSGQEALDWLNHNECDFVLSDVRMPGLDGPALWRKLKDLHPDLVRRMAFITGDTLSASVSPFLKETGLPWLEKPFTPEQVLDLIVQLE